MLYWVHLAWVGFETHSILLIMSCKTKQSDVITKKKMLKVLYPEKWKENWFSFFVLFFWLLYLLVFSINLPPCVFLLNILRNLSISVFALIFFHLLSWKANVDIFSIYSNKFFHNFYLSESSFTCPGLLASGLARRLLSENLSM